MNGLSRLAEGVSAWFRRHPIVADALRWAIPALLLGGILRILFVYYMPYALWGADSRSFFVFTHKLFLNGSFSLGDKRRYLYPLLMPLMTILPGGTLRWLPIFQHALGWVTLVPLAYVVRKSTAGWRLWIIPITIIYAGLPEVLWCEHELLADDVFFALFVWTFAGWVAWVTQSNPARSRRVFWFFFTAFTLFILTKPSGRFVWPGLALGVLMTKSWRYLGWRQYAAIVALMGISLTVGSKRQGSQLFYTATFPLTRLDTPLHADYKAEIRDSVEHYRNNLEYFHAMQDGDLFYFLRDPGEQDARPLWKALGKDDKLKVKVYMDLALEGIKARPDLVFYLGLQRVVFDANLSAYGLTHFADGVFVERTRMYYDEARKDEKSPLRLAFGLPPHGPLPPYEEFQHRLEPAPGSWAARAVQSWVTLYGTKFDFFRYAKVPKNENKLSLTRPTLMGFWMLLSMGIAFLPRYRNTLGVWTIIAILQVFGVYAVSLVNVHYFAVVWPVLFVVMVLPLDALLARVIQKES